MPPFGWNEAKLEELARKGWEDVEALEGVRRHIRMAARNRTMDKPRLHELDKRIKARIKCLHERSNTETTSTTISTQHGKKMGKQARSRKKAPTAPDAGESELPTQTAAIPSSA